MPDAEMPNHSPALEAPNTGVPAPGTLLLATAMLTLAARRRAF